MRSLFGTRQIKFCTANDNVSTETDEFFEHFLEVENLRPVFGDRQHNDAQGDFHLREFIELVEDNGRIFIPLEFDDHTDAVPV